MNKKSILLWGVPIASLLVGFIGLWLPLIILELQTFDSVNGELTATRIAVYSYELERFLLAVWMIASQESIFQILLPVVNVRWFVMLPALFSLYYLYLYLLKHKPIGCLTTLLMIGFMLVLLNLPELVHQFFVKSVISREEILAMQVADIELFPLTAVLLTTSLILGLLSAFICIRSGLHRQPKNKGDGKL